MAMVGLQAGNPPDDWYNPPEVPRRELDFSAIADAAWLKVDPGIRDKNVGLGELFDEYCERAREVSVDNDAEPERAELLDAFLEENEAATRLWFKAHLSTRDGKGA